MAVSLYDATVARFLQTLRATEGVLAKGRAHAEANGVALATITETRLYDDMLPMRFQLMSVAHHSLGAVKGVEAGEFSPPSGPELDYDALCALVTDARAGLEAYTPEQINAMAGSEVVFKMGRTQLPFVAEDFLLTFSIPNFFFHATTAYDILRMQGAPLGKMDFLGQMKMKG